MKYLLLLILFFPTGVFAGLKTLNTPKASIQIDDTKPCVNKKMRAVINKIVKEQYRAGWKEATSVWNDGYRYAACWKYGEHNKKWIVVVFEDEVMTVYKEELFQDVDPIMLERGHIRI